MTAQSVRFTVVACTATRTSPGPTSGAGTSVMCTTSGGPYVVRTAALMALTVTAPRRGRRDSCLESGGGGSATGSTGWARIKSPRARSGAFSSSRCGWTTLPGFIRFPGSQIALKSPNARSRTSRSPSRSSEDTGSSNQDTSCSAKRPASASACLRS